MRLHRLLLGLYPPSFRRRFGPDLLEVLRERRAEARHRGWRGGLRFWTETVIDTVRAAPDAWRQARAAGELGGGGEGNMDGVRQDLAFAVRTLARSPGFTLLAVLTLAVGIGSTSAIFGVVNSVLLRPLPYGEPDRVVTLWSSWRGFDETWLSESEAQAYASMVESFDGLAVWGGTNVNFSSADNPERVAGAMATPDLDEVFGIEMAAGRFFTEAEGLVADDGPAETIVISHEAWMRRYAGDPAIVGRSVDVNGRSREIVGVLPEGFRLPTDYGTGAVTDVYFPMGLVRDVPTSFPQGGGSHFLYGAARLRAGVTPEAARAEVHRVIDRLRTEFDAYPPELSFAPIVRTADDDIVGTLRPAVLALLGTVAFVLLIACANVANLHLTRARPRASELAVRAALGAGRRRIVRQLLTESAVLAAVGGGLGLLLAWGGIAVFRRLDPGSLPRIDEVGIDGVVVAFSLAATIGTVLLFGLVPAIQAARPGIRGRMDGRSGGGTSRWQGALVAFEMALAVILVIGAGLMVRTFDRLASIDTGFDGSRVLSLAVSLPGTTYPTPEDALAFHREAMRSIGELAGVERVAAARILPLASQIGDWGLALEAYDPAPGLPMNGDWQIAAPGYFEIMGIPLVTGRGFEEGDDETAAGVVVVNEAFVRHFWPDGRDPIGRRVAMRTGADEPAWMTVVGVAGDVTHNGLTAEIKRKFYVPLAQWSVASGGGRPNSLRYVIRTASDPAAMAAPVRDLVRRLDPTLAVAEVRTIDDIKAAAVSQPRFTVLLMGVFSLVALLLAAIGIYGVVAFGVTRRVREIGVRMALGARGGEVVALLLRQGAVMVAVGLAVGVGGALVLSRFLASLLYEVPPSDPVTYLTVVAGFAVIATVATWIPARRAARIDVVRALRAD
ncbi:ABC transporter permease [Gemmatimonadota bacterium Y43]|uniref:ABC transporter permease n=1 Tax=Gaopeijia maritima TaxID=3119007 RepID=UPI0032799C47